MSSFSTALSGLIANTTALNVVGDNLANMNTQGFKSNTVGFEDLMQQANASLQIGDGVGQTTTTRNFTQGNITNTGGVTDAAIQGSGFFVVQDPAGTMYTRDGTFSLNSAGQLVTANGDMVQGWMATNGTVNSTGSAGNITVPLLSSQAPSATANMSLNANLDATAAVGDTFSTPIQVVDSLGETHTLTASFTNTAPGAWSYTITIPGQDLQGGTAGTPGTVGTGNVAFDTGGNLTTPAAPGAIALTNTTALADGAATLNINWNLYSSTGTPTLTGYAQTSSSSGTTQDGVQASTVSGISIQNGGQLVANFSDGSTQTIAQLALANISNPETLVATQNNNYTVSAQTIPPSIGMPNTGGRGAIVGESLEASNVDMATEFTNLIVFQSGYEANSKVLTTIDQIDQTLLELQV